MRDNCKIGAGCYNPADMDCAKTKTQLTGTILAILAVVCWVPGPPILKYLANYVDFWTQNFLRYFAAMIILLPVLFAAIRNKKIDSSIWLKALLPTLPNIASQCLWTAAFYYINPAFMTLLGQSQILWTAAVMMIFFADERPLFYSRRFWLGTIAAVIGLIGIIVLKNDFAARASLIGITISLCWAVTWSLYTTAAKVAFRKTDSTAGFAVVSLYTAPCLAVLALVFGKVSQCSAMTSSVWIYLLISAVSSIVLSHSFYYAAIKRIGATIPSLVILAEPFLILIVTHIVFGEFLSSAQWVFGIILIAGAAVAIYAQGALATKAQRHKAI